RAPCSSSTSHRATHSMFLILSIWRRSPRPWPPQPISPTSIRSLAPSTLSDEAALCARDGVELSNEAPATAAPVVIDFFKNSRRSLVFILSPHHLWGWA